tara:strand:+ start:1220 stop:1378 length:159 start_codon:yes stop_codon:yes gene_type:complete
MTIQIKRTNSEWTAQLDESFGFLPINIMAKATKEQVIGFIKDNNVDPKIKFI